jgi:hypothetical protein
MTGYRMYDVIRELICISMLSLSTPFSLLDPCCFFLFSCSKTCSKSRKCSKSWSHVGKCDKKKEHSRFWEKSAFFQVQNRQGQLSSDIQDTELKKAKVDLVEQQLEEKQNQVNSLVAVAAVAGMYKLLMLSMRLCKIQMGTIMADRHMSYFTRKKFNIIICLFIYSLALPYFYSTEMIIKIHIKAWFPFSRNCHEHIKVTDVIECIYLQ